MRHFLSLAGTARLLVLTALWSSVAAAAAPEGSHTTIVEMVFQRSSKSCDVESRMRWRTALDERTAAERRDNWW